MTSEVTPELFASVPDQDGRFGRFGGKFVAETLMSALADLEQLYARLKDDVVFQREFDEDLAHYVGRPSPLYEASRLSDAIGGARILLKREDLNHTGAHKVNNTIGQALLANGTKQDMSFYFPWRWSYTCRAEQECRCADSGEATPRVS